MRDHLDSRNPESMAAFRSLEAFVAYGQLYNLWWNSPENAGLESLKQTSEAHSPTALERNKINTVCLTEETVIKPTKTENPFYVDSNGVASETDLADHLSLEDRQMKLRGCRVLLSEEHAEVQSLQRDISRVQQIFAEMIHEHQKTNFHQSAEGQELEAKSAINQNMK